MITIPVKYNDPFTDEPATMTAHFHLNKNDIAVLTAEANDAGYEDVEKQFLALVEANNNLAIYNTFKKFILRAYGKRQGSEFKKSQAISDEFESSEAFSELIWDLLSDEKALGEFFAKLINSPSLRAPLLSDVNKEGDVSQDRKLPTPDEELEAFKKWQEEQKVANNVFAATPPEVGEPTHVMTPPVDPSSGEVVEDAEMFNPDEGTKTDDPAKKKEPRRLQMLELEQMTFADVQKGLAAGRFRLPREAE